MAGNIKVIKAKSNFEPISKKLILDRDIDALTLGLYAKIMSFGSKWHLSVKGLTTALGMSESKVRASLSLLEKKGYIQRTPCRINGRNMGYDYTIYGEPISEGKRTRAGYANSRVAKIQGTQKTGYPENGGPLYRKSYNEIEINNDKQIDSDMQISSEIRERNYQMLIEMHRKEYGLN